MNESLLISTSDLAELVGERLSVVSTWRNRFKEGPNAFPQPVAGTPARPLFDFDAAHEWVSRNRPEKDLHAGLLQIRVWSALRALSEQADQFDLVLWLHQELRLRKTALLAGAESTNDPDAARADELLRTLFKLKSPARPLGAEGADWPAEIEMVKQLVSTANATDLIKVSDFALARLSAGYGRSGGSIGAVESNISGILASAAMAFAYRLRDNKHPVIYDSSCGIGETLIKTIEAFTTPGSKATALGVEIDTRVAHIASTRMLLRDISANIQAADTLSTQQFPDNHPDIIIAEPPFGSNWVGVWNADDPRSRFEVPPARKADLAWVVDAASRLEGNARALVLTSMGALSNGGAEERVRADLVRSGAVETIIALPPNLLQYTSIPLALWVLRAAEAEIAKRGVMLIDASTPDVGAAGAAKRPDWVQSKIAGWVISPLSADPIDGVIAASVYLHELIDAGGTDLTPSRWTTRTDYSQLLSRLQDDSTNLLFHVEDLKGLSTPLFDTVDPAPHVVTVREMTEFPESREAKLWAGRGASNEDASADTITSRDISAGVLRAGRSDASGETGFWTEPGDIVFTTMQRVKALVDTDGGHHIGNGVYALRLEEPSRFDPEYVAQCLAARWNERHQKGGTIKHAKPGDLEIPLLPLDNQAEWIWSFRELRKFAQVGRDIVQTAESLVVDAQNTLRFGHAEAKR